MNNQERLAWLWQGQLKGKEVEALGECSIFDRVPSSNPFEVKALDAVTIQAAIDFMRKEVNKPIVIFPYRLFYVEQETEIACVDTLMEEVSRWLNDTYVEGATVVVRRPPTVHERLDLYRDGSKWIGTCRISVMPASEADYG